MEIAIPVMSEARMRPTPKVTQVIGSQLLTSHSNVVFIVGVLECGIWLMFEDCNWHYINIQMVNLSMACRAI